MSTIEGGAEKTLAVDDEFWSLKPCWQRLAYRVRRSTHISRSGCSRGSGSLVCDASRGWRQKCERGSAAGRSSAADLERGHQRRRGGGELQYSVCLSVASALAVDGARCQTQKKVEVDN